MTITSRALDRVAAQLDRAQRNAQFAGPRTGVRLRDPSFLIRLIRRASRELAR